LTKDNDIPGSLKLENKVIALTSLKESSDANTMLEIVKSKILTPELINNFVGLSHDNASSLASEANGLVGLLRKEIPHYFYDLPDPAHCLNLALKHSLKALPKNMMSFIDGIHHFFNFPQRKALFKKVQEESLNTPKVPLQLKKYVPTRWTSLGNSLERLVNVWEHLKEFTDYVIAHKKNDDIMKITKFHFQLNNNVFRLKIHLLNNIINKINRLYQKLQNTQFNIGCLRTEIKLCFESIFKLVCKPEKFDTNFEEILLIQWDDAVVQSEWFLFGNEFLNALSNKFDSRFEYLKKFSCAFQNNFVSIFHFFIGKLLSLLLVYLPYKDQIIQFSSFIELKDKLPILEDKMLALNKVFNIVSDSELKNEVFIEILRLRDQGFENFFSGPQDTSLDIWKRIEKTGKYPNLVKFFYFCQILPTSSSDVEQEFSIVKLFKTEQRNSLSPEGLEGLLLINQNKIENKNEVPLQCLSLFKEFKEELNASKNEKRNGKRKYNDISKEETRMELEGESDKNAPISQVLKMNKLNNSKEISFPEENNNKLQESIEGSEENDLKIVKKKVNKNKI